MLDRLRPKQIHLLVNRYSITVLLMAGLMTTGTIASLITYQILQQRQRETTDSLSVEQSINSVTALGYLSPQDDLIRLAAPPSNQRLTELRVAEGDLVKPGQIIAVMDSLKEQQASVKNAEAKVNVARARLLRVQRGEKAGAIEAQRRKITTLEAQLAGDVETQQAVIARQQVELSNAEHDYQRYDALAQAGATSEVDATNKQLHLEVTRVSLQEAQARLNKIVTTGREQIAEEKASLASITTVQPTDIIVAQAELDEALSQLHQAKTALDSVYVRSPTAGQILRLNAKVGEIVGASGIAEIGKTQQMYAIAEVYASDLQYIKIGQPATIVSSYGGFTGEIKGVVEFINLQIAKPGVIVDDPAADTDVRVVKVKIRLQSGDSERVRALNNLEVRASIQIHPSLASTPKQ